MFWINLLDPESEDRYARDPALLMQEIRALRNPVEWIVIDEVQKVPRLLDSVHAIIESKEIQNPPKFALTGSSARKLKRGGANLLAGRAFVNHLFPLTHRELGESFCLDEILKWGSLPKKFSFTEDKERQAFLRSYALTYLKEEVWAEHLVQDLEPFRKFLEIAAQMNGHLINFSKIAQDVSIDDKTVKKYFQILEDILLGIVLEPYAKSVRKRQLKSPKFYLFDLGVKRALDRTLTNTLNKQTYEYGRAFEHFVIAEMHRLHEYNPKDFHFSFFNTQNGTEVDLIVDRPGMPTALVEIKSTTQVSEDDTSVLKNLKRDIPNSEAFLFITGFHRKKNRQYLVLAVATWNAGDWSCVVHGF